MCYSVVMIKVLDVETEAKTEAVYLETETEAQGSCPICVKFLYQLPVS